MLRLMYTLTRYYAVDTYRKLVDRLRIMYIACLKWLAEEKFPFVLKLLFLFIPNQLRVTLLLIMLANHIHTHAKANIAAKQVTGVVPLPI